MRTENPVRGIAHQPETIGFQAQRCLEYQQIPKGNFLPTDSGRRLVESGSLADIVRILPSRGRIKPLETSQNTINQFGPVLPAVPQTEQRRLLLFKIPKGPAPVDRVTIQGKEEV